MLLDLILCAVAPVGFEQLYINLLVLILSVSYQSTCVNEQFPGLFVFPGRFDEAIINHDVWLLYLFYF